LTLQRDTQTVLSTTLISTDTLIVDEGLFPNRQYTYTLTRANDPFTERVTATITTMDTTGHDFTWTIDTLGVTSSVLYDVAVISEDNIWAVGELFLNDSSGNLDPIHYNAAHWDGARWNIVRIPYIYQGSPTYSSIKTLFALSENDIWFSNSTHWNGQQFHNVDLAISIFYGVSINKIWGNPATGELYVVGNSGTIAYSPDHGATWQRLESGTEIDIKDVWGSCNSRTNTLEIACIASFGAAVPQARKLIAIVNGTVVALPDSGLPLNLSSIWFDAGTHYYVSGSGIFRKYSTMMDGRPWIPLHGGVTTFHTRAIRGKAINDVFLAGAFGEVLHFHGVGFRSYRQSTILGNGSYHAVDVLGNVVIAVGSDGAVAVGRRN
jgi:hypothetical protein